jgi:hypothetical protein
LAPAHALATDRNDLARSMDGIQARTPAPGGCPGEIAGGCLAPGAGQSDTLGGAAMNETAWILIVGGAGLLAIIADWLMNWRGER